MKEMLKSKVLVGFVLFVLGFTYIGSMQLNCLESEDNNSRQILYIS